MSKDWLSPLAFRIEAISDPRFSGDVARRGFVRLKLFSQVAYEDAKIFRLLGAVVAPDGRQQRAVRYHALGMPRKVVQNVKFLRRQPYVAAFDLDAVGLRIYAEVTNFDHVRFERLCCREAPKPGSDPCQQFIHTERLRDIVISAGIERLDLGALLISYRKHDDGN